MDLTGANGCTTVDLVAIPDMVNLLDTIVPGPSCAGAEDYRILLSGSCQDTRYSMPTSWGRHNI